MIGVSCTVVWIKSENIDLKLKFRQYSAMHTNRTLYHCTTLQYRPTIIFDMVVMQKQNCNAKNDEFISVAILLYIGSIAKACARAGLLHARHTSMVGNVKIADRSFYCYIHMPTFCIVWLLRNLSLDGKLSSPSLAIAGNHRKHDAMRCTQPLFMIG